MVEVAKRRSLYLLEVLIVSNQVEVIKAMQKAGFETKAVFEDHFILPDGELFDVTYMTLRLKPPEDEF